MVYDESLDNMEFDKKESTLSNAFWIVLVFIVMWMFTNSLQVVISFEDPRLRLLSFIIFMFFTLKIVAWVGHPKLIFKDKKRHQKKTIAHGY